jgi:hypothetical protein
MGRNYDLQKENTPEQRTHGPARMATEARPLRTLEDLRQFSNMPDHSSFAGSWSG